MDFARIIPPLSHCHSAISQNVKGDLISGKSSGRFQDYFRMLVNSSLLSDASLRSWPLPSSIETSAFLSTDASFGIHMGYVQESSSSWLLTALCWIFLFMSILAHIHDALIGI